MPTFTSEAVVALIALTAMEIVLGIDNIIFIAVVAGRLPKDQQAKARQLGLIVALVTRLLLLFTLAYIAGLNKSVAFRLTDLGFPGSLIGALDPKHADEINEISWRDVVMLAGGLFLIYKATKEIHHKLEGEEEEAGGGAAVSFAGILVQIAILDIVFSLDSVITAVGMAPKPEHGGMWVMVAAMVLSMLVMLLFSGAISDFVARHPTVKILALSFLILIGVMLTADGFEQHISKGYIYFAMAFSFIVEMLNLRLRGKTPPVDLHEKKMPAEGA